MTFTKDDVLTAMAKAVEAKGETYRYEGIFCTYSTEDGAPSCIVGYVASILSPNLFAELREIDKWEAEGDFPSSPVENSINTEDAGDVAEKWFDCDARKALLAAQLSQDDGSTWADALTNAKEFSR